MDFGFWTWSKYLDLNIWIWIFKNPIFFFEKLDLDRKSNPII